MKVIVKIKFHDPSDSFNVINLLGNFPYESESLESALEEVSAAVKNDSKRFCENNINNIGVFGHHFGCLDSGKSLDIQVIPLEQWFDENKIPLLKTIDRASRYE